MARLFIAQLPPVASLEAFTGELYPPPSQPTGPAILAKCRELARADSQLLVSPASDEGIPPIGSSKHKIWVIAKVGYIGGQRIQEKLATIGIKLSGRIPLNMSSLLQSCYQFTLTARLAPKWNSISSWLVKGSDFFVSGRAQALSLDVGVTNTEVTLTLKAFKLIFNFLKPDDMEVSTGLLKQFQADPQMIIPETAITSNRCLVLPKFSSAHVYSASHFLPVSMEFDSYDKIRLYWKKQYGLILPERQKLFYQVFFRFKPGNLLTYPGCCVTKTLPVVFPSKDTDSVVSAFLSDVHSRMPCICGSGIKFSNKPLILFASLHPASAISQHPNARAAPVKPTLQRLQNVTGLLKSGSQAQTYPRNELETAGSAQVVPSLSSAHVLPRAPSNPVLSSTRISAPPSGQSTSSGVPVLEPRVPDQQQGNSHLPHKTAVSGRPSAVAIVRSFRQKQPVSIRHVPTLSGSQTLNSGRSKATKLLSSTSRKRTLTDSDVQSEVPHPKHPTVEQSSVSPSGNEQPIARPQTCLAQVVPDPFDDAADFLFPQDSEAGFLGPTLSSTDAAKHSKKPSKQSQGTKCRSTPVQVEGVSEEIMTKVHKAKTSELKKWLQENGVKFRSRDKKDDLVRQVIVHIKETGKTLNLCNQLS